MVSGLGKSDVHSNIALALADSSGLRGMERSMQAWQSA